MKRRLLLTSLCLGLAIGIVATGVVATLDAQAPQGAQGGGRGQGGGGRGPAEPPAPCGPAAQLAPEYAKNVAPNSRCFELRMYTVDPARIGQGNFKGGINELHQRFREKELEIFKKHGAEVIGAWQSLSNPATPGAYTLVWMLAFRNRAHREEVWAAFNKDPEWTELRNKYFVPLQPPNQTFLSAADYSPLK